MIKIKLCGLSRPEDILQANSLHPACIGFVFAKKSKRYVSPEKAAELKALLHPSILAVGVFVNEEPETVAELLNDGILDLAQLHGSEDDSYIRRLRQLTTRPILQAFRIDSPRDVLRANTSIADLVLLDSGGGGTGTAFDWQLLQGIQRPYFLAGGLNPDNIGSALACLQPYGVDVSSGIETDGLKDPD
ncbi:MAG: phosphoribosylanthranilate isomerase [Oscillospiraceae bacterium]|nr:phosphoribosylanthranilate isomerase [Oscillospiraceae bacterium]